MMSRLTGGAKRHSLATFFVLTYALSWWPSILYVLDPPPRPVAGFGPFLAAVWCWAAVAVGLRAGPAHLSRRRRKQEEPPQGMPAATTASRAQGGEEEEEVFK